MQESDSGPFTDVLLECPTESRTIRMNGTCGLKLIRQGHRLGVTVKSVETSSERTSGCAEELKLFTWRWLTPKRAALGENTKQPTLEVPAQAQCLRRRTSHTADIHCEPVCRGWEYPP
eukprot:5121009-Amphidinium_carterae.1